MLGSGVSCTVGSLKRAGPGSGVNACAFCIPPAAPPGTD
jgi:hypothetical protein